MAGGSGAGADVEAPVGPEMIEALRSEAVAAHGLLEALRGDIEANLGARHARASAPKAALLVLVSPEVRLGLLLRLATRARRRSAWIWRNLLMVLHRSEIQTGAVLAPGLRLPHPFGVAIGATTETETGGTIEHHTTFATRTETGRLSPRRLTLARGAQVLNNTVIMGGVQVGEDSTVSPHCLVTHRVRPGVVTEPGSRH